MWLRPILRVGGWGRSRSGRVAEGQGFTLLGFQSKPLVQGLEIQTMSGLDTNKCVGSGDVTNTYRSIATLSRITEHENAENAPKTALNKSVRFQKINRTHQEDFVIEEGTPLLTRAPTVVGPLETFGEIFLGW